SLNRLPQGFLVQVSEHPHLARPRVLHDPRHQPILVPLHRFSHHAPVFQRSFVAGWSVALGGQAPSSTPPPTLREGLPDRNGALLFGCSIPPPLSSVEGVRGRGTSTVPQNPSPSRRSETQRPSP